MRIDPETARKIAEAVASGEATEGPRPVLIPSADLVKKRTRKVGSMREAEFQAQVIEYARSRGWRVAHFRKVRVQRKDGTTYWETPVAAGGVGFPDLLMVRGDRLLVAELKVPPNTTTPEQRAWIAAFLLANVEARVWTPANWPEIEEVLR